MEGAAGDGRLARDLQQRPGQSLDRKSTRLNSSHGYISYAVFCLKKKNNSSLNSSNFVIASVSAVSCLRSERPAPAPVSSQVRSTMTLPEGRGWIPGTV